MDPLFSTSSQPPITVQWGGTLVRNVVANRWNSPRSSIPSLLSVQLTRDSDSRAKYLTSSPPPPFDTGKRKRACLDQARLSPMHDVIITSAGAADRFSCH